MLDALRELVELIGKRAPLDAWVREHSLEDAFEQCDEPGPLVEVAARAGDINGFRRAILACVDDAIEEAHAGAELGDVKHDAKALAKIDDPYWLDLLTNGLEEAVACATKQDIDDYTGLCARDAMNQLMDAVDEARTEREGERDDVEEGADDVDDRTVRGMRMADLVRQHVAVPHLAAIGGFDALAFGAPPVRASASPAGRLDAIRFNVEALRARYTALGLELRAPSKPVASGELASFPKLVREIYEELGGIDLRVTTPLGRGWPLVAQLHPLTLTSPKKLLASAVGGFADVVDDEVSALSIPLDPTLDDPPLFYEGEPSDITLLLYLRRAFAAGGFAGLGATHPRQAAALAAGLLPIG